MESPENINLESISAADIMSDKEHEAWMIEQANRTAYKPTTALILMYVYIIWPIIDVSGVTGKFSLLSLMGKPEDVMVYISMTYLCIFGFLLFMTMAAVDRLWSSEEFRASVLIRNRIQKHLSPRYNADGTKEEPKEDQDQKYKEIIKDRRILHQRLTRQVKAILADTAGMFGERDDGKNGLTITYKLDEENQDLFRRLLTDEYREDYWHEGSFWQVVAAAGTFTGTYSVRNAIHEYLQIFEDGRQNDPGVWKPEGAYGENPKERINAEYAKFADFANVLGYSLLDFADKLEGGLSMCQRARIRMAGSEEERQLVRDLDQKTKTLRVHGRKLIDIYRCVDLSYGNHTNEATVLTLNQRVSLLTGGTLKRA